MCGNRLVDAFTHPCMFYIGRRHRDPNKRPAYPGIIIDLTGTSSLTWSDEDIRIAGEKATVLGNPLSDGCNLFYDLQLKYRD